MKYENISMTNILSPFALAFSLLVSISASAVSDIRIESQQDDCVNGWVSMDVAVTVGAEKFDFSPSCSFNFQETFVTADGVECEITAGMCSGAKPKNRLEVVCGSFDSASVGIACPKK